MQGALTPLETATIGYAVLRNPDGLADPANLVVPHELTRRSRAWGGAPRVRPAVR